MPDLSVDGTIELERLNDVLFMGRPAFGQEQSIVGLFKVGRTASNAERVQVKLGRSSVNTIEVLSGLEGRRPGDPVGHVGVGRVRSHSSEIERPRRPLPKVAPAYERGSGLRRQSDG